MMDAKLAAEIAAAEAELAAARAELAALEAGKLPKEPRRSGRAKSTRRARPVATREVHRPENGMHGSIEGYGGAQPVGASRYRTDDTPIVMKDVSPFDRPVSDKDPRKVSVRVYNDAKQQEGPEITMTEREADEIAADLPLGWSIKTFPARYQGIGSVE